MASYQDGKIEIVRYVKENYKKGETCLDVGACDGKYADLLGDWLEMDGVEIFEPNIRTHNLEQKYRTVFNRDIADLKYNYYDLIIFGDVIEHMEVEKAQKVLEYAKPRCRQMIVAVPYRYPQGEIYGNPYERHIQDDLTPEIFDERYPGFKMWLCSRGIYAYYMKDE